MTPDTAPATTAAEMVPVSSGKAATALAAANQAFVKLKEKKLNGTVDRGKLKQWLRDKNGLLMAGMGPHLRAEQVELLEQVNQGHHLEALFRLYQRLRTLSANAELLDKNMAATYAKLDPEHAAAKAKAAAGHGAAVKDIGDVDLELAAVKSDTAAREDRRAELDVQPRINGFQAEAARLQKGISKMKAGPDRDLAKEWRQHWLDRADAMRIVQREDAPELAKVKDDLKVLAARRRELDTKRAKLVKARDAAAATELPWGYVHPGSLSKEDKRRTTGKLADIGSAVEWTAVTDVDLPPPTMRYSGRSRTAMERRGSASAGRRRRWRWSSASWGRSWSGPRGRPRTGSPARTPAQRSSCSPAFSGRPGSSAPGCSAWQHTARQGRSGRPGARTAEGVEVRSALPKARMWILIENGEVYGPSPLGRQSLLVSGERIARVGGVARREVEALGIEIQVVDAAGCIVIPGIVDPHQNPLGESSPHGLGERSALVRASDLAAGGVTTGVGCLGVDAGTTTMKALLARATVLREQGPDVHVWTGGSRVRATLLESACADLVTFADVIGTGEVADFHGSIRDPRALASLASDAYLGGTLSGKAGVTHLHLEGREPAAPLLEAFDEQRVPADRIFVALRGPEPGLLDEAVRCARWGAYVGVGAEGGKLEEWVSGYLDRGGNARRLVLFSDAPRAHPRSVLERVCALAGEPGWPLEAVLPWATSNPARMLGLDDRGTIEPGRRADLVVLRRDPLRVVEVIARGRRVMWEGEAPLDPNLR